MSQAALTDDERVDEAGREIIPRQRSTFVDLWDQCARGAGCFCKRRFLAFSRAGEYVRALRGDSSTRRTRNPGAVDIQCKVRRRNSSLSRTSRVWFTLSHGILSMRGLLISAPRFPRPARIRDLRLDRHRRQVLFLRGGNAMRSRR